MEMRCAATRPPPESHRRVRAPSQVLATGVEGHDRCPSPCRRPIYAAWVEVH